MYICRGEIAEASVLHGTEAGRVRSEAETFKTAQDIIRGWMDSDIDRSGWMDGSEPAVPSSAGENASFADWTYWIEEEAKANPTPTREQALEDALRELVEASRGLRGGSMMLVAVDKVVVYRAALAKARAVLDGKEQQCPNNQTNR